MANIKDTNKDLKKTREELIKLKEEYSKLDGVLKQVKQSAEKSLDISLTVEEVDINLKNFEGQIKELNKILTGKLKTDFDIVLDVKKLAKQVDEALEAGADGGDLAMFIDQELDKIVTSYAKSLDKHLGIIEDKIKQTTTKINLGDVKNFVPEQEALTGHKMDYQDQVNYYNQQLPMFIEGEKEYIEVLKLRDKAMEELNKEMKSQGSTGDNAGTKSIDNMKNKISGLLTVVGSVASGVNNAINKIISTLRGLMSVTGKVIAGIVKSFKYVGSTITNILKLLGGFGNRVRDMFTGANKEVDNTSKSFGKLGNSATELRSKIMLLKGAFSNLINNELIKNAKELMGSIYSLKNIAGTGLTQNMLDWANSMERAFGLSATSLIADINELTGVLYGLGMTAEHTVEGSKNILMISRYLAFMGAAGGDVSKVTDKLVSGLKGMTQAIDDLGLSVRTAQMNEYLKSLKAQGGEFANIGTNFEKLNEEARVYVRYASLISQFNMNYDMTDFIDSLSTVTGRFEIMRQRIVSIRDMIGTGLMQAIYKVSSGIIVMLSFVERQVVKLFSLLNIDVTPNVDINKGESGLKDFGRALDDVEGKLEDVEEQAKRTGNGFQKFDRISSIDTSKDSGKDSGKDAFDYSKLMMSAIDELNRKAEEATNSYIDNLKEKLEQQLKEYWDMFNQYAKDKTGRVDFDLGFDFKQIQTDLKNIIANIKGILANTTDFVITLGLKIADDLNIGLIITKIISLIEAFTRLAKTITDILNPALQALYDNGLRPIVEWIGETVIKVIDVMISEFDKWSAWFEDNGETIIEFFSALGRVIEALWEIVEPYLTKIVEFIIKKFEELNEWLRQSFLKGMIEFIENEEDITKYLEEKLGNAIDYVIEKATELWDVLKGGDVEADGTWGDILGIVSGLRKIMKGLAPIVLELVEAFAEFSKETLLPWLSEKLEELGEWLQENKDQIVKLSKEIGKLAWETFEKFVDILGRLIDYVVNNPESVATFFKTLAGIKIGSWALKGAAGIGKMLLELEALKAFKGIGEIKTLISGGGAVAGAGTAAGGAATGGAAGGAGAVGGIAAAANPVGIAIAAVLGASLIQAFRSEDFRNTLKEIGTSIKETFDEVMETFGIKDTIDDIKESFEGLGETFGKLMDDLEPILEILWILVGGAIEIGIVAIGAAFKIIAGAVNIVIKFIDIVVKSFMSLIKVVDFFIELPKDMIEGFKIGFTEGWDKANEFIKGKFEGLITSIKNIFGIKSPSTVFKGFGDNIIQGFLNGITEMWDKVKGKVTEVFSGALEGIKNVFSGVSEWFSGKFKEAKDLAVSAFDKLPDNLKGTATTAFNNITGAFSNIKTAFTDIASKAADGFSSFKDKASKMFKDVVEDSKKTLNKIGDGVGKGVNWITEKVTGGRAVTVNNTKATSGRSVIPHARGGSIAGGELFIANENGEPELIGKLDGTGRTNVANNDMIMESVRRAISIDLHNIMAGIMNAGGLGKGGDLPVTIEIKDSVITTEDAMNKLAYKIQASLEGVGVNRSFQGI